MHSTRHHRPASPPSPSSFDEPSLSSAWPATPVVGRYTGFEGYSPEGVPHLERPPLRRRNSTEEVETHEGRLGKLRLDDGRMGESRASAPSSPIGLGSPPSRRPQLDHVISDPFPDDKALLSRSRASSRNVSGATATSSGSELPDLSFSSGDTHSSAPRQSSIIERDLQRTHRPWLQSMAHDQSRTEPQPSLRFPFPRSLTDSPSHQRFFSPFPAFTFDSSVIGSEPPTHPHLHPSYQAAASAASETPFALFQAEKTNPQALPLPPPSEGYVFPDSSGRASLSGSHIGSPRTTATPSLAPPGAPRLGPTRLLPSPPSGYLSTMIGTPSPFAASPSSLSSVGPSSAYPFPLYPHSGSTASTKTLRKSLSTPDSLLELYRAGTPPPPPTTTPRNPIEALATANERIRELEEELAELKQAEAEGPGRKGEREQGKVRGLKRLLEQRDVLGSGSSPVLLLPPSLAGLASCPVCSQPHLLEAGASPTEWTDEHWKCLPRLGREGKVPVFTLEE
ncbi:hypothetical protein JCM5296_005628 [Sporobolomyces johnsonii]